MTNRELGELDSVQFPNSKALSFTVEKASDIAIPCGLSFINDDEVHTTGPWFTEAHIEMATDDSVSCTLYGQKVFMSANPDRAADVLYHSVKSMASFLSFIESGPGAFSVEIFVILTNPGNSMVQPSLSFHVVLTISGPSLVCGLETGRPSDKKRLQRLRTKYFSGIGIPVQMVLDRKHPIVRRKIAKKLAIDDGGFVICKLDLEYEQPKRHYISRKRSSNLPNVKAKINRYRKQRKGACFI